VFYDFAITVPAGTAETSPKEERLKLSKGIIHRVEVEFYPGCRRYVEVVIFHGNYQLYPTNRPGAFSTDGYTIAFDDYYELPAETNELVVSCWSPDADYDHVIVVRIGVMESKMVLLLSSVIRGLAKMLRLMGISV